MNNTGLCSAWHMPKIFKGSIHVLVNCKWLFLMLFCIATKPLGIQLNILSYCNWCFLHLKYIFHIFLIQLFNIILGCKALLSCFWDHQICHKEQSHIKTVGWTPLNNVFNYFLESFKNSPVDVPRSVLATE